MKKRQKRSLTLHNRTFTFINREKNNVLYFKKRQREFLDRIQDMFRWNTSSAYLSLFRSYYQCLRLKRVTNRRHVFGGIKSCC